MLTSINITNNKGRNCLLNKREKSVCPIEDTILEGIEIILSGMLISLNIIPNIVVAKIDMITADLTFLFASTTIKMKQKSPNNTGNEVRLPI